MSAATVPLTAYASPELKKVIDELAKKKHRTRSELLLIAINDLVQREAEQERMTREALQDVDNGNFISQREMEAWADSLSTDSPLPSPFTKK